MGRPASANTKRLQGLERLRQSCLFSIIDGTVCYSFQTCINGGFRSRDSLWQAIPVRLQQSICVEKVPVSIVCDGCTQVASIAETLMLI